MHHARRLDLARQILPVAKHLGNVVADRIPRFSRRAFEPIAQGAVLMIVDACEGASRSLSEPTPKRLERLVHEIAMKRLLDGQFDESGLTLTELHLVEESLTKSLIAMYHGRVKYPEQRSA